MNRVVVIDAPAEALDDLKDRLAKEKIEHHPFVRKAIGATEGIAIACSVANLAKLIWDWYCSWRARRTNIEVQVTVHPDNISLKLSPDKRIELEILIHPPNAHESKASSS